MKSPFPGLRINWRWSLLNMGLALAVVVSAITAVQVSHQCRALYSRLQQLEAAQWGMQENWGRLLLEESTWAAHHRVEQVAEKRLGMKVPLVAEIRVVMP